MAKTKISEYSATANSNTDVASINIDEGCAPSGINNAIRAVMGHLKDFQQGTNGDPFNGPVNGTLGATTASTAVVTTLNSTDATDASSTTAAAMKTAGGLGVAKKMFVGLDANIYGITVGRGAGADQFSTAVGNGALSTNTASASSNTAVGRFAVSSLSSGIENAGVGRAALSANTSGSYNTGIGHYALLSNTTASNNTAVGYQAGYSNQTGSITALGASAGRAYNSSTETWGSVFVGATAGFNTSTGANNVVVGSYALRYNETGNNNTAIGAAALYGVSGTSASYNTAVGYQAGYSNTTAAQNTFIGSRTGYSNTTGTYNTFVGDYAGYSNTTGTFNTFVGVNSTGYLVTIGSKNTILGGYSGNQGGLDIRTASNYIVLSDGDGNPRIYNEGTYTNFGNGSVNQGGSIRLQDTAASGYGPVIVGRTGAIGATTDQWFAGSNSAIKGGTTYSTFTVMAGGSGGVNLTSGATSWVSASDAQLKNVTGTYTNALADIAQIQAVKFTWKDDPENKPCVGVIAQSVEAVVPEAIDRVRNSKEDETEYLGVRYTELIPLLIASIQELKAEIDQLKGQS